MEFQWTWPTAERQDLRKNMKNHFTPILCSVGYLFEHSGAIPNDHPCFFFFPCVLWSLPSVAALKITCNIQWSQLAIEQVWPTMPVMSRLGFFKEEVFHIFTLVVKMWNTTYNIFQPNCWNFRFNYKNISHRMSVEAGIHRHYSVLHFCFKKDYWQSAWFWERSL